MPMWRTGMISDPSRAEIMQRSWASFQFHANGTHIQGRVRCTAKSPHTESQSAFSRTERMVILCDSVPLCEYFRREAIHDLTVRHVRKIHPDDELGPARPSRGPH